MKINKSTKGTEVYEPSVNVTHGGAKASNGSNLLALKRSVLATMLWEDTFYESGEDIAKRIESLVAKVPAKQVAELAVEVRSKGKLRHVPLLIARAMARIDTHKPFVAETLTKIIQRPDELTEFLSIYWKEKKQPLSAQVKKGLASAFLKFDEYSLAKYNRQDAIKLRDVLFLTHAKPVGKEQEQVFKKLIGGYCAKCFKRQDQHAKVKHPYVEAALATPDTWEVALSASEGENKKDVWERLLSENKLGALALIRNLRNFEKSGVDENLVKKALRECKTDRVLPFRFISAVKYAPRYQSQLEELMLRAIEKNQLKGKTVLIVDVSGSMSGGMSAKSEMSRLEAAASLAILVREMCEDVVIYATGGNDGTRIHKTALVRPHRGFALRDEIVAQMAKLGGGGIFLKQAMDYTFAEEKQADRVIVITDEQDCDHKANPDTANAYGKKNYIINIASYENGIAFKKFSHVNGFSESVLNYIAALENLNAE
jgi:60 kDa SS-A/Ro ribonucleoprotein